MKAPLPWRCRLADLPMTRKIRLLVLAVVVVAMGLAMAGMIFFEFLYLRKDAESRFGSLADMLARESTAVLAFANAEDAKDILQSFELANDVRAAWMVTKEGKVLAEYQRYSDRRSPLPEPLSAESEIQFGRHHVVVHRPVLLNGEKLGVVVVKGRLLFFYQRLGKYLLFGLVTVGLAAAATLWIVKPWQRHIVGPLVELSNAAQQVARDKNYQVCVPQRSRDEVGQLVAAFNHMLGEVRARDQALAQAHATLEQRVQERTAQLQHEIVERRQIEEELRASEQRFAQIFRASPIPMVLRTLGEGRILEVNDQFTELFGYSREEAVGRTIAELGLNPDPAQLTQINSALQVHERLRDIDVQWRGKGGRAGTARLYAEKIQWIKAPCLLVVIFDTTQQTKLEQQLRHAQKMDAVGKLAAGVAHDFNNILTIIQGNASLGLSEPNLPAVLRECLDQIAQATERAASLTRQLLAFSRSQAAIPVDLDLNQVIVNFSRMLHRVVTEKVKLSFNLAPEIPAVRADPGMVEQVLTNLCVNARDAMPQGGELVIATEEVELDESFARSHPRAKAGRFVRLQVTDTGMGMPPEMIPHIFDPFFTTKEVGKGSGLGLAAVHGIVDLHGGWIDVESQPGAGSTFSIFWPVAPAPSTSGPPGAEQPAVQGGRETILLVEDEPAVRGIARQVLKKYGYTVVEAVSGKAALKLWPAVGDRVSLVVSDVVMPDGVSGKQLAEALRQEKPELPIILVSGYSAELSGPDVHVVAGCKFLAKPFKPIDLVRLVRELLDAGNGHGNGQGKC